MLRLKHNQKLLNRIDFNTPISDLQALLEAKGWISHEQIKATTKAGEGNMNMVMRVDTDQRSFILKQPRPFVFKYPDIPAPEDRILTEYQFHQVVSGSAVGAQVPRVLHFDPADYLLMSAFIEEANDMIYLYETGHPTSAQFTSLINGLNELHALSVEDYPPNQGLKALNHQHIFHLPFIEDNGFSLDTIQPGLQAIAEPIKRDKALYTKVENLGKSYLGQGEVLLHGDYYPGSWMQTEEQVYIIDAEFSHLGFREFDLGVMAGHLIMASQEGTYLDKVLATYQHDKEEQLVRQMAGIEIIRRLIGLAQLPMERTLEQKQALLKLAKDLILS